jgi:serine/threonine protein phosphatase PrpC
MAASSPFLGTGTTVVGLLLTASRALWFNIEDSRLYHFGDRRLVQLSVDDVPRDVRNGTITQSLGGSLSFTPVAPHMSAEDLVVPSRWLLCSDGLTDMVGHAAIEQSMAAGDEEAVRLLFAQAMDAGGADNISIIVASVTRDVAD